MKLRGIFGASEQSEQFSGRRASVLAVCVNSRGRASARAMEASRRWRDLRNLRNFGAIRSKQSRHGGIEQRAGTPALQTPALLASVLILAMLSACAGNGSSGIEQRVGSPAIPMSLSGGGGAAATQQIEAPVDSALMDVLQAELTRILEANPPRGISTPPNGERAAAPLIYNAGNSSLVWGYYSPGDYDQNGLITVSDLTPLGQNFGKVAIGGSFPVDSTEAVVDGDGNGEINLADVTPIGVNFGVRCSGYNIYVAEKETAVPPTPDSPNGAGAALVDSVSFNSANLTGGRKNFTLQVVPTALQQWFWVRPTDGTLDGAASTAVAVNLPPAQPPQAKIAPTGNTDTMAHIVWDASGSFDPDGEIVSYEWDFDGDGQWDYTTDGNGPRADFYYYEAGEYSATVRVTDDTQRTDSETAVVNITQAEDWHETVVDERLNSLAGNPVQGLINSVGLIDAEGRPALFYVSRVDEQDENTGGYYRLFYSRADDEHGTNWSGRTALAAVGAPGESQGFHGAYTFIDERPAVVVASDLRDSAGFFDSRVVNYHHAANPAGSQWNPPVEIRRTSENLSNPPHWLVVVDGNPAICQPSLREYLRASDPLGNSWPALPENKAFWPEIVGGVPQMATTTEFNSISGVPSMLWQITSTDIVYYRATDVSALDWQGPVLIDKLEQVSNSFRLFEVGSNPALTYYDSGLNGLKYRRALDPEGSAWSDLVILDVQASSPNVAGIIDGRPAVLYSDRIVKELRFIVALDELGDRWGFPMSIPVEKGSIGYWLSDENSLGRMHAPFVDINGMPAMAYYKSYTDEEGMNGFRLIYVSYY